MTSEIQAKGIFHLRVYDHGKLVETYTDENLIVTVGKNGFIYLLTGETGFENKQVTQIAFGSN